MYTYYTLLLLCLPSDTAVQAARASTFITQKHSPKKEESHRRETKTKIEGKYIVQYLSLTTHIVLFLRSCPAAAVVDTANIHAPYICTLCFVRYHRNTGGRARARMQQGGWKMRAAKKCEGDHPAQGDPQNKRRTSGRPRSRPSPVDPNVNLRLLHSRSTDPTQGTCHTVEDLAGCTALSPGSTS